MRGSLVKVLAGLRPRGFSPALLSAICFGLMAFMWGCFATVPVTPSVSVDPLPDLKKLPAKVVVLLPDTLKDAVTGAGPSPVWAVNPEGEAKLRVGESTVAALKALFPMVFESVDFVETGALGASERKKYDFIVVPRLLESSADSKGGRSWATISYSFGFQHASDSRLVEEIKVIGSGNYERGAAAEAGTWIGALVTIGTLGVAGSTLSQQVLFHTASAMARAQEEALRHLVSRLPTSRVAIETKVLAERRASPSGLETEVSFEDGEGIFPNGRLDAGEEAELVVTVRNQGAGAGYGVVVAVSADQRQVSLPGPRESGEIPPGQNRKVRLPLKAGLELASGVANLVIEARERRGYDARRVRFVLPTVRLERPALSITAHEVIGSPANGETIELLVSVRNAGPGPAAGAVLALTRVSPRVTVVRKDAALGRILPDRTVQGRLALTIPRTYLDEQLGVGLQVVDGRGAGVGATTREVALPVRTRRPELAATTRILGVEEDEKLTNDQTVELEVIPRNTGSLDAEEVLFRVRTDQPGVSLEGDQAEIGSLKAGAVGLPQRFRLTVPRVFDGDRLSLRVELTQRDFPGLVELLELPVRVRRPVLASDFRVIGRHRERILEQNETAELEVRILNTGDLAARDVQARIEIGTPGVQVHESQSVVLGSIPDKEHAVARFRLRLLRSAPLGDLPIALTITQADFPALNEILRAEIRPEQPVEQRAAEPTVMPMVPPPQARPPVIVVVHPGEEQFVYGETVELRAVVVGETGLATIPVHVAVNEERVPWEKVRHGLQRRLSGPDRSQELADLRLPLRLVPGKNTITVRAYNRDNQYGETSVTVTREDPPSDPAELGKRLIVMIKGNFGSPDAPTIGAGIVIGVQDDRLYVATANHVVRQRGNEAQALEIQLWSLPGQAIPVTLTRHHDKELDLAVLVLEGVKGRRIQLDALPFGRLGRSDALGHRGDVWTLGYPEGRRWWYPLTAYKLASADEKLLKFQAPYLAKGDSGGGLFNAHWELVGMVVRDGPPVGEAVPIERVIERLRDWGYPVAHNAPPR